jgi:hypothetical protein
LNLEVENGGDDETRTRDLCRDSGPLIGFITTYKTAGTAKGRLSGSKSYKTLRAVGWIVGWIVGWEFCFFDISLVLHEGSLPG